ARGAGHRDAPRQEQGQGRAPGLLPEEIAFGRTPSSPNRFTPSTPFSGGGLGAKLFGELGVPPKRATATRRGYRNTTTSRTVTSTSADSRPGAPKGVRRVRSSARLIGS